MPRLILSRGQRHYVLQLEADLFEDFVITRQWYGGNNARHGRKQELCKDYRTATERFEAVHRYLVRVGYTEIPPASSL